MLHIPLLEMEKAAVHENRDAYGTEYGGNEGENLDDVVHLSISLAKSIVDTQAATPVMYPMGSFPCMKNPFDARPSEMAQIPLMTVDSIFMLASRVDCSVHWVVLPHCQ